MLHGGREAQFGRPFQLVLRFAKCREFGHGRSQVQWLIATIDCRIAHHSPPSARADREWSGWSKSRVSLPRNCLRHGGATVSASELPVRSTKRLPIGQACTGAAHCRCLEPIRPRNRSPGRNDCFRRRDSQPAGCVVHNCTVDVGAGNPIDLDHANPVCARFRRQGRGRLLSA